MSRNRGCLFALFDLLFGGAKSASFPYKKRERFLSNAEISFYNVLRTVISSSAEIFPHVAVRDLLSVTSSEQRQAHFNRISSKQVDFLICATGTLEPLVVVELDDKSHDRADRAERDQFIDSAFAAASIPVIHMKAQRAYKLDDIRQLVMPALDLARKTRGSSYQPNGDASV